MKILKWVLWLIVVLIVLVVGAVGIAIATLDPNDYKPRIAEQVEKQTGRKLTIAGDINWSLYPWLGLSLGETVMGNAPGFGDEPFAKFSEIDAHVELLPLLKKQVRISTVKLKGLQLNLQRNASGADNWSDLAKEKEAAAVEQPAPSKELPAFALEMQGVLVEDASLVFDDAQSGKKTVIAPLDINTGALRFGQPMPAQIKLTLKQDKTQVDASLDGRFTLDPEHDVYHVESRVDADISLQQDGMAISAKAGGQLLSNPMLGEYQLDGLSVDATVKGEGFPEAGIPVAAKGDINANLEKQTLTASKLNLTLAGVNMKGDLNVASLIDAPQYSGKLETENFSPRKLMQTLGMTAPATAKASALGSAQLGFAVSGDTQNLQLKPLQAKLDDSTLSGEFAVKNFSKPALRYTLNMDKLNADDYLPPATAAGKSAEAATAPAAASGSDAISLPVEMLRKLDLEGTASIGSFVFKKLMFTNAALTLMARNGVVQAKPLVADAYDGKARINASLNVQSDTPVYQADMNLNGVRSEKILLVLYNEPYVSGSANLLADVRTSGNTLTALKKNLAGNFDSSFRDGNIKGSKLAKNLTDGKNALYKLRGKPPVEKEVSGETRFSLMQASGQIANGIVTNKDLRIEAPVAFIKGEGKADIPAAKLDYMLYLADEEDDKKQRFLPIEISGPFANLSYKLRVDELAKERLNEELEKKKEEAKQRLKEEEDKLREKLKEQTKGQEEKLKEKLGDEVGDALKGLFKK